MEPEGKSPCGETSFFVCFFFTGPFRFGLIFTIFSDTFRSLCLSWGPRMSRVLGDVDMQGKVTPVYTWDSVTGSTLPEVLLYRENFYSMFADTYNYRLNNTNTQVDFKQKPGLHKMRKKCNKLRNVVMATWLKINTKLLYDKCSCLFVSGLLLM